ncbi:MAK10-like protein [Tanacetum coccineum]
MRDENPICTLRDYSKPSHKGYRNTIELPEGNNVVPLRSDTIRLVQNGCSFHRLRSKDPNQHLKDFLELPVQLNKIASSCEICSGPHDTQYCIENPEQAFVDYASSRTNKAGEPEQTLEDEFKDLHLNLPVLEVLAHALMYNAILDKYVESLELGKNRSAFIQGEIPKRMEDPRLFTLPCRLGNSKPFDTLANLGSCVNIIPLYLFKKLKIMLLEETGHVFRLADGTKSYLVGIVRDVEVHLGRLKLLNDFYVIDMKKDPETPLLVGRGFLATANAVIDCRKAKVAVGEGITRLVFGVKETNLGEQEAPYWTTLGKRESYKARPSSDSVGAQTPYYARKEFMNCHLPREWEIARDAKINPFKDVLVFRQMVEFLEALPINLKGNM